MAMESACKLQVGKDHYEGHVRMEGDFIDFAGATKFRFRLGEIRTPRCEADVIMFSFHGNPVSIGLGEVQVAEEWIEYILNPQTLADKLGVEQGDSVRLLNLDDEELLSSLAGKEAKIVSREAARSNLVMLGVERASELRQIEDLTEKLRPNGAIWVVLPKGGRMVTKANVVAKAREVGFSQVETLDFSETQSAFKMVRPTKAKKGVGSGRAARRVTAKAK